MDKKKVLIQFSSLTSLIPLFVDPKCICRKDTAVQFFKTISVQLLNCSWLLGVVLVTLVYWCNGEKRFLIRTKLNILCIIKTSFSSGVFLCHIGPCKIIYKAFYFGICALVYVNNSRPVFIKVSDLPNDLKCKRQV